MPLPTVIETARLTLRPPTAADRDTWVRLHRDPRTYAHAPHAMASTDDEASAVFEGVVEHWQEHGYGYWMAVDRAGGEVVGVGGVKITGQGILNLYYRLAFERLGSGFGRELARASVAHAVEFAPALPLRAAAAQINEASVNTALAAGLERAGTKVIAEDPPGWPPSVLLQAPRVEVMRSWGAQVREQVLDVWVRTNDAGGAVGFVPGAPRAAVDAALSAHEESMAAGDTVAVLLRSSVDARVVGVAFVVRIGNPLLDHVRTIYRVMTDPEQRGRNLGRLLMAGVHRVARDAGVEIVTLGVRSGTRTSGFYAACGYVESGRVLGAIRVAHGDDRDDITMTRRLDDRVLAADPRN